MNYKIRFTVQATEDVLQLKKTNPGAYVKLQKLLLEIQMHPYSGTGKPKRMKYDYSDCYSRRITLQHRIVYKVDEETIEILILSAYGHYKDK